MSRRYRLDGPEPPHSVRRVQVGPNPQTPAPYPHGVIFGAVGDVWWRRECRQACRKVWSRRYGCKPYTHYRSSAHYHWFNGDRDRPWDMIHNRAVWDYGVDLDSPRPWTRSKPGWRKP